MQHILWEGDTPYGHYQVVDETYDGRPARLLYSGDRRAAQSGVAQDDKPDLLFDYNQRLFELAISLVPKRILLIGGGVFTLPAALLPALPHTLIDVVEPDSGLPELAGRFFGLPDSDRLRIFTADGRSYLREHAERYDLIIIDAYSHTIIPREIKTLQAFRAYRDHLEAKGVLAMNVISGYHGSAVRTLHEVYAAAVHTFERTDIFLASRGYSLWLPQNFILVAQKVQDFEPGAYLRHKSVKPPEVFPDEALEDKD
ncbi:MAG TPA: fused MFS/spermidine synthase [Candidatus Saccharimonadales bacterium]|jgi:spermidine synthase